MFESLGIFPYPADIKSQWEKFVVCLYIKHEFVTQRVPVTDCMEHHHGPQERRREKRNFLKVLIASIKFISQECDICIIHLSLLIEVYFWKTWHHFLYWGEMHLEKLPLKKLQLVRKRTWYVNTIGLTLHWIQELSRFRCPATSTKNTNSARKVGLDNSGIGFFLFSLNCLNCFYLCSTQKCCPLTEPSYIIVMHNIFVFSMETAKTGGETGI